jgi:hypothetical protein
LICLLALLASTPGWPLVTHHTTAAQQARSQPSPGASDAPGVCEELLGIIPDTPQTRQAIAVSDYDRMRRHFGIAPPEEPSDDAQREAHFEALAQVPRGGAPSTFLSGLDLFGHFLILAGYLGYRRVDQDIVAGLPPGRYEAVRGAFDPAAAEREIVACAGCPPPDREQYLGVAYYSWDEDFHQNLSIRLSPPAFDQLGRGGRIAVTDEYVFRALWTGGLRQMISAWRGGPSLRADPDFRLLARGLDSAGAYTAYLTDRTQGPALAAEALAEVALAEPATRMRVEAAWNPPAGAAVLEPYVLLGVGVGRDSAGEPYTAVVLVHATEQAARENVDLLRRRIGETVSVRDDTPWSRRFTSVDAGSDSRVLVAMPRGSAIGAQFLYFQDPLLLHR